MKAKLFESVKPYGYFLRRKSDGMKYVGVRYANVKLNLTPSQDFGKVYFTSGRLRKEFKRNPENFEFRLCYTFDSMESMWDWEKKVVMRVYKYPTWANRGWSTNFGEHYTIGKLISQGKHKIGEDGKNSIERGAEALKDWLQTEEGLKDVEERSERMRRAWREKSPEELKAWKDKRNASMDFEAAAKKAAITLSKVGEDGLTGFQRNSRKATEKMIAEGTMSRIGKDRNKALNKKVGEMTEEEFEKFCENKALCFRKGMLTRRNNYIRNRDSINEELQT